jgi:hypothetical protein
MKNIKNGAIYKTKKGLKFKVVKSPEHILINAIPNDPNSIKIKSVRHVSKKEFNKLLNLLMKNPTIKICDAKNVLKT